MERNTKYRLIEILQLLDEPNVHHSVDSFGETKFMGIPVFHVQIEHKCILVAKRNVRVFCE
jgi:hypothetical protein